MSVTRKEFMNWLHNAYDMNGISFSKGLAINLTEVVNGTYRGLNKSVPYNDLLDMWQRKWNYLEKLNAKDPKNGEQRIYYDLSVILSKYSSYLAWKAEQEAKRIEEENKTDEVEYIKACRQLEENRKNNAEELPKRKVLYKSSIDDLSEVLDEMWVKHD